jgi:hypothetical protein
MSRPSFPPKSYGQSDTPPTSTSNTNAVLSNSSANPTPSSTSNTNTVLSNRSTNPTPSTSNLNGVDNTRKKSSSPNTRTTISPTMRQSKEKQSSAPKTKRPISPRTRELEKRNQNTLTDSSVSESEKKHVQRSGTLSDSFEDDAQISKEVSVLDATSEEAIGSNRFFSEPKLSVRTRHDSDETLSSSTISQSEDSGPIPSYAGVLVKTIWDTIDNRNWMRLENLIISMRENSFRFDHPSMKDSRVIKNIVTMAPLALLGANENVRGVHHENRWIFALDLLDLGCDWNVKDRSGNRVIDLLRKQATPDLIQYVAEERPNLRHLFPKP